MRRVVLGVPLYLMLIFAVLGCQQWSAAPMPSHVAEEGGDLRVTLSGMNVSYTYPETYYRATMSVSFTRPVLGLTPEMFQLSACVGESVVGSSKIYTFTLRCNDLSSVPEVYLPALSLSSISGYSNVRSNSVVVSGVAPVNRPLQVVISAVQLIEVSPSYIGKMRVEFTEAVTLWDLSGFETDICIATDLQQVNSRTYTLSVTCDSFDDDPVVAFAEGIVQTVNGKMNLRSNDFVFLGPTSRSLGN